MTPTVERTSFDLRYQEYRLRNAAAEARLLASIAERGVEQPLAGVDTPQGRLLLNGFKRFRCATKLGIECLPYASLGEEESQGIVSLMRVAKDQTLNILEQAKFVVELLSIHEMSVADVAERVSRSKAWVSMRRGLLKEISQSVQEILFRGDFPVYSYMYTLRPFMRMNGVSQGGIERFIQAVAGQRLSVREIELLADGYFRGPASLRQEIDQGNWKWSLQQLQSVPEDPGVVQRHRFTRELWALSRKVTLEVFVKTVQRALRFRIVDLATVRRIAWLFISPHQGPLPEADIDADLWQRPAYQEGCLTREPDLSVYDQLTEEKEDENDIPW